MAAIEALDRGVRGGPDPELSDRSVFSFVVQD